MEQALLLLMPFAALEKSLSCCVNYHIVCQLAEQKAFLKLKPSCHSTTLWHMDQFKVKTIKAPKTQEISDLPNRLRESLFLSIELSAPTLENNMDQVWWETLEISVISGSHCLCRSANIYLPNIAFPTPCELPSSPLKSQTTPPTFSFCLELNMVFKVSLGLFSELTQSLQVSPRSMFSFCMIFSH